MYKRKQYWICKRLHVNIYENKKVCTNWVRRILMTEVAYDIIKTFRNSNDSYRQAKFESYIQFIMKTSIAHSVVLNLFMSKVMDVFDFKSYSDDQHNTTQRNWVDINKFKIYTHCQISERLNETSSFHKVVAPFEIDKHQYTLYSGRIFMKNIFKSFIRNIDNKEIKIKFLNKRYASFSEYWYRGIFPELNSFRVTSFHTSKAEWKSNIYYRYKYRTESIGPGYGSNIHRRSDGYISSKFSRSELTNSILHNSKYIEYSIRNRIIFRLRLSKILLSILYKTLDLSKLFLFVKTINYVQYKKNNIVLEIIVNLIRRFSKTRLIYTLRLLQSYNFYDFSYLLLNSKYNLYTDIGILYLTKNRRKFIKEYRSFFCKSNLFCWYPNWIYAGSRRGSSELVKSLEKAYRCVISSSRYEDFDIVYNTNLHEKCYFNSNNIMRSYRVFFIKWYYLFLVRDQYMVHHIDYFYGLEHQRRMLLRNLFLFRVSHSYSSLNFMYIKKYFCEGYINTNLIYNDIKIYKYTKFGRYLSSISQLSMRLTSGSYRFRNNIFISNLCTSNFGFRKIYIHNSYISYTKGRKYFTDMYDYGVYFKEVYFKCYILYHELRNRYILYGKMYNTGSYRSSDVVLLDNFHYKLFINYFYRKSFGSLHRIFNFFYTKNELNINNIINNFYYLFNFNKLSSLRYNFLLLYKFMDNSGSEIISSEIIINKYNFDSYTRYMHSFYKFTKYYYHFRYNHLGLFFFRRFYSISLNSWGFMYIVQNVLEDKFNSNLGISIYDSFEEYRFVDGIYDKKHKRGRRGGYVSRPIERILRIPCEVPDISTVYNTVINMLLNLFLYRFQYSYSSTGHLMSWYLYIRYLFDVVENFKGEISEFERELDPYQLEGPTKLVDDKLYYSFENYKFINDNIECWQKFRKHTVYSKFQEYFFLIDDINQLNIRELHTTYLKRFRGSKKLQKYGYGGKFSKSYVNYNVYRGSFSFSAIVKKLFIYRLRLKNLGGLGTLLYWAELQEDSGVSISNYKYNTRFFNYLISGHNLRDDRYLSEQQYYFKTYHTHNIMQSDYLSHKNTITNKNIKLKFKLRNFFNEQGNKYKKDHSIIDYRIKDPRDFFNPFLESRILFNTNYQIQTAVWDSFTSAHIRKRPLFEFPEIDVIGRSLNSFTSLNLYTWYDFHTFLYSEHYNFFIYDNYHLFRNINLDNNFITLNKLSFNSVLYNMINSKNYNYAKLDAYVLGFMDDFPRVSGIFSTLHVFRNLFLKNLSFFIKFNYISKSISRGNIFIEISSDDIENFISHNFIHYYYSSSVLYWYISLMKCVIQYCYRVYLKSFLSWINLYKYIKRNIKKKSLNFYSSWVNRYKFLFLGQRKYSRYNLLLVNNIYHNFFEHHIGRVIVISSWLKYWLSFIENKKFSPTLNFVYLNNYIYNIRPSEKMYSMNRSYINITKFKSSSMFIKKYVIRRIKFFICESYMNLNLRDNYSYNLNFYQYLIFKYFLYFKLMNNIYILCTGHSIIYSSYIVLLLIVTYYRCIDRFRYWFNLLRDFVCSGVLLRHKYNLYKKFISIQQNLSNSIKGLILMRRYHSEFVPISNKFLNVSSVNTLLFSKKVIRKYYNFYNILKIDYSYAINRFYIPYFYTNMLTFLNLFKYWSKLTSTNNSLKNISITKNLNIYMWMNHIYTPFININNIGDSVSRIESSKYFVVSNIYLYFDGYREFQSESFQFSRFAYLNMFEVGSLYVEMNNLHTWMTDHYLVKIDTRRYYSKFWYRYVPEDIVHIQKYRRFQQELRRLIANRKRLRSGIIYRRLLIFKLVPGVSKDWHKLHVKRPYMREQFEDRVRFFYIMKYKYKIKRKRLLSSLYNRFSSPYTYHRAYHLLYFRLDNILYKLSFIPTFHYLRDRWSTQFWNISINTIMDVSYVQRSLIIGDMFYIKSGLHTFAISFKLSFHYDNNFYLVYLLWLRFDDRDGMKNLISLPSYKSHICIGRTYLWYWFRYFKIQRGLFIAPFIYNCTFLDYKLAYYGFWAHNFLMYKQFKSYMLTSTMDHYVRWYAKSLCGFVYREPLGFTYGLHYVAFNTREGGAYGGHLRFTSIYK